MIFITGDLHGALDIQRLDATNFPEQSEMSKDDFLIIAGDFGLVWNNSENELSWRDWLAKRNFTTLFIDGNHENHDLLDAYPVKTWKGGKVHFVNDSIIHLMRGQVYEIQGLKFFTFGGGESIDQLGRTPGESWWAREMPSWTEYEEGLVNLEKHNWVVDFIVTHECSEKMFDELTKYSIGMYKYQNHLRDFLEEIEEKVSFKQWFFGHYHDQGGVDDLHTLLYRKILRIGDDPHAF